MERLVRFLAIIAVILIAVPAYAQEQPPPESPVRVFFGPKDGSDGGHFQVTIEPGASQQLTVVLGNYGQQEIELLTSAGNAYTAVNGGFALQSDDAPLIAPATWLGYPTETHMLAPGEAIEQSFTVSVPAGTPVGWYLAGISVRNVDPVAMGEGGGLSQVIRKVLGVSILVPGEITPGAELGTPTVTTSPNAAILVVPIENTGNIRLRPEGDLSLRDGSGEVVLTGPVMMRPIYAGHATTIEIVLPPQLPPATYLMDLHLADADGTGWSGALEDQPLTVSAPVEATPAGEGPPVEVTAASVSPVPDAASGDPVQFAAVTVEITNRADAVPSARLTLIAMRDGEVVEEFVLVESLALVEPVTTVEQRYIPLTGWEPGTWSFRVGLESVDPGTGVEAALATFEIPETIVVAP